MGIHQAEKRSVITKQNCSSVVHFAFGSLPSRILRWGHSGQGRHLSGGFSGLWLHCTAAASLSSELGEFYGRAQVDSMVSLSLLH